MWEQMWGKGWIVSTDGKIEKYVKNLGWLLKHCKDVDSFIVVDPRKVGLSFEPKYAGNALLTANLRDGRKFEILFADKTVLWNWLKRPVFLGLFVNWFGKEHIITSQKEW